MSAPAQAAAGAPGARAALARSLGREAIFDVDPSTGTVRNLQRLDGALSGPSSADAATTAMRFVRANLAALGLTAADVDGVTLAHRDTTSDGVTHLRWTQTYAGIPLYGGDLRVNLDRANRVIDVGGSPLHGLRIGSTTPGLSAAAALAAVRASVHGGPQPPVRSQARGARRHTRFDGGDSADLALVSADGQTRLAWALTYRASSTAHYFALVDARSGRVVKRDNLVLFATNASIFRNYPGAPSGGAQETVDIAPYLNAGATTLAGPNAHAWADVNDDGEANAGEEVAPGAYAFTDFTGSNVNGCDPSHKCSWNDSTSLTSWQTNESQDVAQVFWYVNNFHDHLLSAPIGFGTASGNFQDDDPVLARADDGADILDGGHVDNASMQTLPEGVSPVMSMFLFFNGPDSPYRDINGGDAAAVVYHEYTHGLSSRLDVDSLGLGALWSPQSGAMGEAWSDFYAMDYLVREGLVTDTNANGDIDMGAYTDATPNTIRTQPLDCPVGSATNCPGGSGGYTYRDFATICCGGPEVHADGEIWGETLWDLRQSLVAATGSDSAGSDAAERLVTGGLRLAPPEPSFLDMRNAILAESTAEGGARTSLVWDVFAARGMGFLANTDSSADTAPTEDFSLPPAPGSPSGTVEGTVTDAASGLPVPGAVVGFPPYTIGATPDSAVGAGISDSSGGYTFDAPATTYSSLTVTTPGYDPQSVTTPTTLTAGQTLTRDFQLARDWASRLGGASVTDTNDDTGYPYCGADRVNDQDESNAEPAGWSSFGETNGDVDNPHFGVGPFVVVELPVTIDVTGFGVDPTENCGDTQSSALKGYLIETSPDGITWTPAAQGAFSLADRNTLDQVPPTGGTHGVRYVRLTVQSTQGSAARADVTELEVYGAPTNQLPSGTLSADASTVAPGGAVNFAASMTDPDSQISGYDWDFNGDGVTDASTDGPTAAFTYASAGTFRPKVSANDSRGGAGSATTTITVASPPPPSPVATASIGKLSSGGTKGRLSFTVTFSGPGSARALLKAPKKLKLKSKAAGTASRTVTQAGTYTVTIRLTSKVRALMRRLHLNKLKLTLQVTASPTGGRAVGAQRTVQIRI